MTSHPFLDLLKTRLKESLPGKSAHQRMSPIRRFPTSYSPNIFKSKEGAVLILLYKKSNEWYLPLILRPTYDGEHSGQISLPGGKKEEIDASHIETALRETEEEIGIKTSEINFLGALTPIYIPKSNYIVHPFIGFINTSPQFVAEEKEVAKIIELPISTLSDSSKKSIFHYKYETKTLEAPSWIIEEEHIWGATAMILAEFEALINPI